MCRCERLDEAQFVRFRQLVEDEEEVGINCCTDVYRSTPLISLCLNNHSDGLFDCVELLLQRPDIQINRTDVYGRNALMRLCVRSESDKIVEVAQFLIDSGIEINQTDEDRRNALMLLCLWSESDKILEVAQLLIAKGIGVHQRSFHTYPFDAHRDGMNAGDLLSRNPFVSESKKQEIFALL